MNVNPLLNLAAYGLRHYVDKRQKQAASRGPVPEGVTERILDDEYFQAMAEDIESRVEKGEDLSQALREVYREQGPVLLRPAPEPENSDSAWVIPLAAGALAGVGLGLWALRRRWQ